MIMVLTTESPPITSASNAAPVVIALKVELAVLKALTGPLGGVALTTGTCLLIRLAVASSWARVAPGWPYTVKPSATWLVSTAERVAGGGLAGSSIGASALLTETNEPGAVPVLARTPTTVKGWLTKLAGASFGRTGRLIV